MFGKGELKQLQRQKDLLVLQSDANRLLLTRNWQRLRSPENWLNEAGHLARRHPVWTAALATTAGVVAVQAVRKSGLIVGGFGRAGKLASMAFSAWKLFKARKTGR